MPVITLPDGNTRSFDGPVSVADIAASIGAGLAKAALAGKVDGVLVDTSALIERDAAVSIVTDRDPEGLRDHPPFHGAPAGQRRSGAVPRGPGHHRPGDRGRFLLRLRLQAAVFSTEDLAAIEQRMARDRGAGRAGAPARAAARCRGGALQEARRALQGRDHRTDPLQTSPSACMGRATGRICAADRTCRAPASSRHSSS